ATWLSLVRAQDGTYRNEPLASLGDSLALCRIWASASALSSAKFDVGAYEMENVLLIEVDTQGRRRTEVFAAARLSDAVARLYERSAALPPEGPARARAAATARSVAGLLGSIAADRYATALAPAVKYTDHRPIGFGSLHGAENLVRGLDA